MAELCDDERMLALVEAYKHDDPDRWDQTNALLAEFPEDARLHFMLGSMLIGEGRFIEGHASLQRSVQVAPDFAIARFQLGFFELTSGEADNALETWGRLDRLPEAHYLRRFVDGLRCLIRDEFAQCAEHLQAGVALNTENPPLNRDMGLIIAKCDEIRSGAIYSDEGQEPMTETALILQQFTSSSRQH